MDGIDDDEAAQEILLTSENPQAVIDLWQKWRKQKRSITVRVQLWKAEGIAADAAMGGCYCRFVINNETCKTTVRDLKAMTMIGLRCV